VALVAQQLGIDTGPIADQACQGRTGKRHRAEIRVLFGFRESTVADSEATVAWLRDQGVCIRDPEHLAAALKVYCRSSSIESPTPRSRRPHRSRGPLTPAKSAFVRDSALVSMMSIAVID
jgi:hypothetical protein